MGQFPQRNRDVFSEMMFGNRRRTDPFFTPGPPMRRARQPLFPPSHPQQYGNYQPNNMIDPFAHDDQPKGKYNKLLTYFTKDDGSLDYEKIGSSAMQVYGIAGKVAPMVKNLSPLLSLLKK